MPENCSATSTDSLEIPSTTSHFRTELAAQLAELVPEAVADGKLDIEKLRELLADDVADGNERFGLFWPGKKRALRAAQMPTTATLKPDFAHSKDWDTTQNVFIEGDNLEVLKTLQRHYHNKIKLIYIDPPYNTGKDFVYPDNFKEGLDTYLEWTRQVNEEGKKVSTNSETEGRYHSNWLNMMYPRLKLARNLLTDDGVIFISIDDNEVDNLKKLCNEVFGEGNFIAQFVWNTEGHTDNQFDVKVNHEYVLLFARNADAARLGHVVDPNTREGSNLWKGYAENSITKNGQANPPSEIELPAGFPCLADELELSSNSPADDFFAEVNEHGYITRSMTERYDLAYPLRLDAIKVKNGCLVEKCRVFSGWANANKLKAFISNQCEPIEDVGDKISFYLSERGVVYYRRERDKARNILSVLRNFGTTERMRSELEEAGIPFQYPKPKELLRYLVQVGAEQDAVILDFFSGSATTAHAVMALNAEDGGKRRFIMVQLPEPTPEESEARKAGFNTIADISRKRIELAGEKIKADSPMTTQELDTGFRAYKLADTSFSKWRVTSEVAVNELEQHLLDLRDSADDAAQADDLLTELLLKLGYSLTEPVHAETIAGLEVRKVGDNDVLAYLDEHAKPTLAQLRALVDAAPARIIVLEDAFQGDDELKTNLAQFAKSRGIELWTA